MNLIQLKSIKLVSIKNRIEILSSKLKFLNMSKVQTLAKENHNLKYLKICN